MKCKAMMLLTDWQSNDVADRLAKQAAIGTKKVG